MQTRQSVFQFRRVDVPELTDAMRAGVNDSIKARVQAARIAQNRKAIKRAHT